MQTKYGGANLYDCLSRIPWLSTTKLSIDVRALLEPACMCAPLPLHVSTRALRPRLSPLLQQAGTDVQNLFKNPLLEITFFAPDSELNHPRVRLSAAAACASGACRLTCALSRPRLQTRTG